MTINDAWFHNSGAETLHLHAVPASPIFEAPPQGAADMVRRRVPV